jgi:hypothetical protein
MMSFHFGMTMHRNQIHVIKRSRHKSNVGCFIARRKHNLNNKSQKIEVLKELNNASRKSSVGCFIARRKHNLNNKSQKIEVLDELNNASPQGSVRITSPGRCRLMLLGDQNPGELVTSPRNKTY